MEDGVELRREFMAVYGGQGIALAPLTAQLGVD